MGSKEAAPRAKEKKRGNPRKREGRGTAKSGIIHPHGDESVSCSSHHGQASSSSQEYEDPNWSGVEESADLKTQDNPVTEVRQAEDSTGSRQIYVKKWNPWKRPRTKEERLDIQRRKHPLLSPCAENCRQKCRMLFTEEERGRIHEEFWSMHYDAQRQWLLSRVLKIPVQRKRPSTLGSTSPGRSCSIVYTFLDNLESEVKVCQTFFIRTLGYSSNRVIVELLKNCRESVDAVNKAQFDKRGRHPPENKKDHSLILKHIEKYNPQVSHYRLEHTPNRRYISSETTLRNMYEDFQSNNPDYCTYVTYCSVFKKSNIVLGEPKEDICDICDVYKNLQEDEITDSVSSSQKNHIAKVEEARKAYSEDKAKAWGSSNRVYAVDMQKVLLLPMISGLKTCIFTPRLIVFNETFASMKVKERKGGKISTAKDKHYVVLWDESTAGRNEEHVTNAFLSLIKKERDATDFVFWADSYATQKKNWCLFSAMVILVNSENEINSINFRYLTAGHTFMVADDIHGHIERSLKRQGDIYDFEDLKNFIQTFKRLEVLDINKKEHFFNIPVINTQERSQRTSQEGTILPNLETVVDVKFEKGTLGFYYKESFKEEYKFCNFVKKTVKISCELLLTPLENCPRGLSSTKKKNIIEKLVCKMPLSRREFWVNMPESSTSKDLLTS